MNGFKIIGHKNGIDDVHSSISHVIYCQKKQDGKSYIITWVEDVFVSKPAPTSAAYWGQKEQKSRRVIKNKYLPLCQRPSDPMTVAFIPPPQSPFTDIEIGTGSERGGGRFFRMGKSLLSREVAV